MSFVRRVLASINKGLSLRPQIPQNLSNSPKPFCSYSSRSSNSLSLVERLIKESNSRVKPILDSEANSTLQSLDFSWHALVSALNSSSNSKALQALEWRLEKLVKCNETNQEQYSELISLCGETRNLHLAMRVFVAMESVGVKPTTNVFNSLISVSLSLRNQMTALSLFEIMERSQDYKPNSKTYNAFISMYSKAGNLSVMEAWLSAKTAAGFTADLHVYESLISGCIRAKRFDFAVKYYEEMMSLGFIPNTPILEKMVDGLYEQRDFAKAKEFLLHMLENGWEISPRMAQGLARLYSEMGNIEEVNELLEILVGSNQSPEVLYQVHLAIISTHARAD